MMSPVCDPSRVTRPADPAMARIGRGLDNRAYVRKLLREKQPDFADFLQLMIRMHRCEHANHS